ncbi:MAG: DUF2179 domain-containing protein [Proteobacteria bacterium]|nr:DUF2179 domain-containing protein [Pseudomonadota bacterium]
MEIIAQLPVYILGPIIFCLRVVDVSLGTIRTIMIVQGRTTAAFSLGFFEILVWLAGISTVVVLIQDRPVLVAFYALGFASGNVAGIRLEQWMAPGHTVLHIISDRAGKEMAAEIRGQGFAVTTFSGEGMCGPVTELYVVCRRRDLPCLIRIVRAQEPNAFYTAERAGSVSRTIRPFMPAPTGWRAVFKKK